jgi:hypothetical protein
VILTADLTAGQQLGDLRVVNPFETSPADLSL